MKVDARIFIYLFICAYVCVCGVCVRLLWLCSERSLGGTSAVVKKQNFYSKDVKFCRTYCAKTEEEEELKVDICYTFICTEMLNGLLRFWPKTVVCTFP